MSHCVGLAVCLSVCLSVGRPEAIFSKFNKDLHEVSIPRVDVHILKGLQLHVKLQSYGPFNY